MKHLTQNLRLCVPYQRLDLSSILASSGRRKKNAVNSWTKAARLSQFETKFHVFDEPSLFFK